jgi:RNA polymerase sigma-54 factor
MLSLQTKLAQTQKLSPQQIQYQKLLQLNNLALVQRIKNELEINPVLEEVIDEDLELSLDQLENDNDNEDYEDELVTDADDEFDIEDYVDEDEYEFAKINRSPDEEKTAPFSPARTTLTEHLTDQLRYTDLTEEEKFFGEHVIGSLDNDGYFKEDLETFLREFNERENLNLTLEQAEKVLKTIQHLDPPGIAARNLQECLLAQMEEASFDPYYKFIAEKILREEYKNFTNKRFDLIKKNLNITDDALKTALELIQKLNPKPGEGNIQDEQANQITPDFIIEKVDGNYIITLNDRSMPSVTISPQYLEMLDKNKGRKKKSAQQKEVNKFLREKIESAKWFIYSIEQRRQTLMKIMRAIFEKQHAFFEYGPRALKPMIYKDIADEIGMDISTISRVVNGKYVQSPQGIHELKYFFSEGLKTDDGEEISNKHIKELIKEIIENEPKNRPYSDDKIAKILQEKGIRIARRTVAKYREQMKIPVARLRKVYS